MSADRRIHAPEDRTRADRRLALILLVFGSACGPRGPGLAEAGGDSTSGSESDGAAETGAETETGSAAEHGTETETETETETGLEPDLPPDDGCVAYPDAGSFDELCFGEALVIDPAPVNHVEKLTTAEGPRYYVGGPDYHRLYAYDDDGPLPNPEPLAIDGTVVGTTHPILFEDPPAPLHVIATKQPNTLVVLALGDPVEIAAVIPLDAEPSAVHSIYHGDPYYDAVVLADLSGRLALYTATDVNVLELDGWRQLDEPIDELQSSSSWVDEWSDPSLVGFSRATSLFQIIELPTVVEGPLSAWQLPLDGTGVLVDAFAEAVADDLLVFSRAPAAMALYAEPESEPDWSMPLPHPIHHARWQVEHWAGHPVANPVELYGLSIEDRRIGSLGTGGSQLETTFQASEAWVEVPDATVDFLPIGGAKFLCASTTEGLSLLAPLP